MLSVYAKKTLLAFYEEASCGATSTGNISIAAAPKPTSKRKRKAKKKT